MNKLRTLIRSCLHLLLIGLMLSPLVVAQRSNDEHSSLVERVGSTGFLQVEAESFNKLTPKQQALAYWLTQASIAVNPIIFDQQSRFGLRQKHILESQAERQRMARETAKEEALSAAKTKERGKAGAG